MAVKLISTHQEVLIWFPDRDFEAKVDSKLPFFGEKSGNREKSKIFARVKVISTYFYH